jgi:hypothetical protein
LGRDEADRFIGLCELGRQAIKKPKGQAGCLSRGGYSLRAVLSDWSPELYESVQVWSRKCSMKIC